VELFELFKGEAAHNVGMKNEETIRVLTGDLITEVVKTTSST
jgi:hypothetical protein